MPSYYQMSEGVDYEEKRAKLVDREEVLHMYRNGRIKRVVLGAFWVVES